MKRKRGIAAAAAIVTLAAAPAAVAQTVEFAFGSARQGSLIVSSGIGVAPREVSLRGGWVNEAVPCTNARRLRVRTIVSFSPPAGVPGRPRNIFRTRTGAVTNCAEGGPNFGVALSAAGNGLACPDGRWKPGFYSFAVTTTQLASGLRAIASLGAQQTDRC